MTTATTSPTETNEHAGSHRLETVALSEERSLLLTFLLFAVIVVLAALAAFGLAADTDGTGSLTSFTESMGTALTPGV